ncbi:TonB-dependent receptor plug domain-containing protein [Microvirga sp. STR05]|uniref:TonB-dependent receptor plug domain-containing protein n=1 Tax=Hymenobacter duratus TaxID=2771356 RepID=A0ABR8JEP4_9BACT|nr:TonB-dependent receptor plug domain-containing protein [Hymenobacter duratus]MBD2714260.1 TonB-dependent receptor plug domain-containing protein [Hymenobacter duratus]MBR7949163.1 TonB-dependent receptor plug domain-containing protein [Microvirga sp. STR05]
MLVSFTSPADDFTRHIAAQLERFYALTSPEKVYLQFDKDVYNAGETLWFKGYVVAEAPGQADSVSQVLYVDLIGPDQKLLVHQTLAVQAGGAPGSYILPGSLPEGVYTVRAYTNWMRNTPDYFFTRTLPVLAAAAGSAPKQSEKAATTAQVGFFPEGGELVAGLPGVVAFKATGPDGRGLAVSGTVQDDQGVVVSQLRSQHLGMGRFELQPTAGRRYTAKVRYPSGQEATYELPAVQPAGLTLQVQEKADAFQVLIRRKAAAGESATERITLVAHVRGTLAYAEHTELSSTAPHTVLVPKSQLPAGILHFTVFDGQQVARCERLAFSAPGTGARLTVQPTKKAYGPQENVTLRVAAQDAAGKPLAGSFSLAVTDVAGAPQLRNTTDIRTSLLLTSDLQGAVEQPGYYFATTTPATTRALDDLLLTQGWRRFVWKALLTNQWSPMPYAREQSLSMSGQVLGKRMEPLPEAAVVLTSFRPSKSYQTLTDAEGRFTFSGFSGQDSAAVRVVALPTKSVKHPQLVLDDKLPAIAASGAALWPWAADSSALKLRTVGGRNTVSMRDKTILLNEVVVQDRAPQAPRPDNRRIYSRPDATILTKDIAGIGSYKDVVQVLQGRVAGLTVVANQDNVRITMRGKSSASPTQMGLAMQQSTNSRNRPIISDAPTMPTATPLFLLDGVPTDINMINSIPVVDIEAIEVLKPGSAAIFGERGASGAIAFLTKHGNPNYRPGEEPAPTVLAPMYAPPRLQRVREFYTPAPNATANAAPAGRSGATLYWNPSVQTDASGVATISFGSAARSGSFRVVAEGITRTNEPVRATEAFKIEASK